jgi:hypothetical protein
LKSYFLLVVLSAISCTGVHDDPIAQRVERGQQKYIMLTGKRKLNTHDPASIGQTYQDTFLIQVPSFSNGTIHGRDIQVKQGYYMYSGALTISEDRLEVDLTYSNTDDHITEPLSWNGTYRLK